jgi:hypothetical protein
MKKTIISILLSGLGLSVFAQAFTIDSSFVPSFDIRSQRNATITNLFEYQSGKVIIQGNFRLNFNNTLFSGVLSTSRIGNIVTNYQVLNGNNSSNILMDINSNKFYFGVGNSNGKLIDSLGNDINPIWQTNFFKTVSCFQGTPYFYSDGSSIFPNGFSQTANGPCPIVNLPDTFAGRYLVKVKPDGLWDSTFAAFPNWTPSGVIRYDSTRLLVFGSPSQFTHYNGVRVNGLCRIFHDGSLDTTFQSPLLDTSAFNVIIPRLPDSSGKIFLCGKFLIKDYPNQHNTLVRLTIDGQLDTTFSFNNGPTHNIVHGGANVITKTDDGGYIVGKELPNGNFICAGTSVRMYNNQQIDDVNLSMLDSAGNQLWSRDYNYHGLGTNEYVKDLIITSDGGFAMTGFILNAPGGTGNDVFVLKTDTNGLITSLNSGFREITPDMRVYPNPTKDFVNIPYVEGLERVEVYDVAGKLLQDFVMLSSDSYRSRSVNKINLSNYKAGIYILKLLMKNGEVYSKKVIKE